MPSSTVYAIEEDDGGMLWISTPNGLIRLDPESRRIRNFDFSDGLQDDEFNFGASFKDSQGRLYFGGNRGFNRFDPADIPPTRGPPRLVFTQIEIAGRPVIEDVAYVPPDKVELAPDDYYATFQFSALDYTEPSRNRYQYKLENFDRRWVDIANRNTITFTSLPSGQYRLRVRAANAGGNWNNIGLTLPIDVLPNKYLTWWAFSIYGALLWAIGWLIKKSYDRWMLLENVRGEASVNFSVAERAMDDLQEYQETGRSLLRNLRKHNERLLALVPRLLSEPDYRRETGALPSSFKVSDTRLRCMLMLEHHLSYAGDILQIDLHGVIEELFEAYDDHMQRGELLISPINECTMAPLPERLALPCALIINELIHNSLSHAFEGLQGIQFVRVFFEETASKDGWTLIVQDSGTGNAEHFVPATDSGGGLQLVHELTLDLGGALTIDHQGGTTVRIDIPFSGDLC
jgi:two-component sensor histidine kinase